MELKLKNKVAVVTGASKGIGAAIAKTFAQAGAKVVVNYASSKEDADKVVNEIIKNGGHAIAVQCDVSKIEDVEKLFKETKTRFGKLDVLVNNAGIYQFEPLGNITEKSFHLQFNINVLGTILSTQEGIKLMNENGGSVINLSSIVSVNPAPYTSVYSATKGAVNAITIGFAKELGAKNIRVNVIAPGAVETEGAYKLGFGSESEMGKQFIAGTPLGRFGLPDDIAKLALFLASDDASLITGEKISISGGAI